MSRKQGRFPGNLMLGMPGGGRYEELRACHGHEEGSNCADGGGRGDLGRQGARTEERILETCWRRVMQGDGGLKCRSEEATFNPKGNKMPLEVLEEETHRHKGVENQCGNIYRPNEI